MNNKYVDKFNILVAIEHIFHCNFDKCNYFMTDRMKNLNLLGKISFT